MARQFRSDDSSIWLDQYGNGADGAYNPGVSGTDSTPVTTITGTTGQNTASVGSATGFADGALILIHQTQGTSAGVWELNKISSGGATTSWTLAYNLQNTYSSGAQVYRLYQYSSANISSGITINGQSWNGSFGGIFALLVDGTATIAGTVNMNYIGFRAPGGEGNGSYQGRRGEGTAGNDQSRSTTEQGSGGGGGGYSNNSPWDQGNGAGGGGSYSGVQGGSATGGGNNSNGGAGLPGDEITTGDCTVFSLGGAGGEGGNNNTSGGSGGGGNGGGCVIIIAKTINITGAINAIGGTGGTASYHSGSGGSGGGGICLLKGQTINIGTDLINIAGGPHVNNGNHPSVPGDEDGGAGGQGVTHIDYSTSVSGTTVQGATIRKDGVLGLLYQRQFRIDDTNVWPDRYGAGNAGNYVPGGSTTDTTPNTTFSGSFGATTGTVGSNTGFAAGDTVLIHQTQGAGAGTWELNKIAPSGISGTTFTFAYPLMNTYSAPAQIYRLVQYLNATINSGITITGIPWNGSNGGIFALFCSNTITINGIVNINGWSASGTSQNNQGGFRGGHYAGVNHLNAYQGEGTPGGGSQGNASANGDGGGGTNNSNQGSGGGGGHGTAGGNGTVGQGGLAVGTADLTSLNIGGGGGSSSGGDNSDGGLGGNGGGIVILIARNIVITGTINLNGGNGGTGTVGASEAGGAGGAGGAMLMKGQSLSLGSNLITATGGAGATSSGQTGGAGAIGRIHADYLVAPIGTTNPTIDTRFDPILADNTGLLLMM